MARCDLFNCRILVWIFCFEPRHVEAWEGQELEQQEHQLKEQAACSSSMSHTWSNVNFRRKCFSRKLLNSSDGDHEVAAISGSYSLEEILRIASCWEVCLNIKCWRWRLTSRICWLNSRIWWLNSRIWGLNSRNWWLQSQIVLLIQICAVEIVSRQNRYRVAFPFEILVFLQRFRIAVRRVVVF
jgi:hypothetical protein